MASEPNPKRAASTATRGAPQARVPARVQLRELESLFESYGWSERRGFARARKRARERALEMLESHAPEADASRAALLVASAELFRALIAEHAVAPHEAPGLASEVADVSGLPAIL